MSIDIDAVMYFGFPFLWTEDYEMDEKEHERLSALVDEDDDSIPYPVCGKKKGEVNIARSGDFYNGYLVHYVYIIGTEKEAGRYDHVDLSPADMMAYDLLKWRQSLHEFCTVNNIPWQEPGWKMTANHS